MSTCYDYSQIQKLFFAQVITPNLAKEIGLEESIVVNQLHYWLMKCPKVIKNVPWIFNTFEDWCKQFPYWSLSKIKRIFSKLESDNIVCSIKRNAKQYNQTKWYTINYNKLSSILESFCNISNENEQDKSIISNETNHDSHIKDLDNFCDSRLDQIDPINKETYNTKTKNNSLSLENNLSIEQIKTQEMLSIWNEIVEEKKEKISITPKRQKLLIGKLNNFFDKEIAQWKKFCIKIASSKFLMGEITNFKANIDWVLNDDNFIKIQEDVYKFGDRILQLNEEVLDNKDLIIDDKDCPEDLKLLKKSLFKRIGKETYNSWFKKVVFTNTEQIMLQIKAPTKFIATYIEQHFQHIIKQIYDFIIRKETTIKVFFL